MNIENTVAGSSPSHHHNNVQTHAPAVANKSMGNIVIKHQEPIVPNDEHAIQAKDVKNAVSVLNEVIEQPFSDLKFVYHEELHEYYVTLVNPITNETVKEIPPKKMLDMYASMVEFMGVLVDEKI